MTQILSKRVKILFTLSFLLNILLIGFLVGQVVGGKPNHKSFKEISPASQEIIKETIDKSRADMREQKQEVRQLQTQLRGLIEQEAFDKEQFKNIMGQLNDQKFKMSQHRTIKMTDTLAKLPVSDRKVVFKKMMKGGHKKGEGRNRH